MVPRFPWSIVKNFPNSFLTVLLNTAHLLRYLVKNAGSRTLARSSEFELTNAIWNPVAECTKPGPNCDNCHAECFAERRRSCSQLTSTGRRGGLIGGRARMYVIPLGYPISDVHLGVYREADSQSILQGTVRFAPVRAKVGIH